MNETNPATGASPVPIRSLAIAAVLAGSPLAWLGCQPDHTAAAPLVPPGVYTLVSVDGKPVPAQVTHGGHAVEVRSGQLSFGSNKTCDSRTVFLPAGGREVIRDVQATYAGDEGGLKMKWKGAGTTKGTWNGETFTLDNEGLLFVYRR